jgi:hypothetical protein
MSDEGCLGLLDEWILNQKNAIYDQNIKGPNNNGEAISKYFDTLINLSNKLCRAITIRDREFLLSCGWSESLIDCINDVNMRTEIKDRIETWFKTYPNVKGVTHLERLLQESGLE